MTLPTDLITYTNPYIYMHEWRNKGAMNKMFFLFTFKRKKNQKEFLFVALTAILFII